MADYKERKGATGKKYTTYDGHIKVTYTDGSTRIVRPSDASYAATKEAMEKDIAGRNLFGIGNKKSNVNAANALGNGKTDGLVSMAGQPAVDTTIQKENAIADRTKSMANLEQQVAINRALKAVQAQNQPAQNVVAPVQPVQPVQQDQPDKVSNLDVAKHSVSTGVTGAVGNLKQFLESMMRLSFEDADAYRLARTGNEALTKSMSNPEKTDALADYWAEQRLKTAQETAEKQQALNEKYNAENFNKAQQLVGGAGSSLIQLAPAMLMGGPLGTGYIMAQGFGAGGNQALMEGATQEQADDFGLAESAKEVAINKLINTMPGIGGIFNPSKLTGKIANPTLRTGVDIAARTAGEGAEESLSTFIDPYLQRAVYNPDAENATMQEIIDSAIMGMIAGGTANIGAKIANPTQKVANQQENVQENPQKMTDSPETAQNRPEQAQEIPMTENPRTVENVAQNQSSQAVFEQKPVKNVQNQKTVENTPKKTLEMAERTFENVGDKKVLAYQQEHPEVKPYQQDVASRLLYDLQMGEKGRREVGIDAETRNVTTMQGIKRNQSEPINRMRDDGLSYNQIEDGLNRIVEDNGKENTPNAKRVELYVHDAVKNGFNSVTGERVNGNAEYKYRNMSRDELLEIMERLDNSFTGNAEADAAIISEMETVQNLLNRMQENKATDEESSEVDNIIVKNVPSDSDMPRIQNEYKNAVDEDMYDFINDARTSSKTRYYKLSGVTDSEAADIQRLIGIDTRGFSRKISSNSIRHIDNRHGVSGIADSSLKDDADIARMNYVLENYDTIEDGGYDTSHAYVDKNNNPAPVVKYSKRVNGTYYVVEAVPDTAWKSLQVVTAYKSTKKEASKQVVDTDQMNLPQPHVQNAHAPDASLVDNIIPQNQQEDNTNFEAGENDRYQELIDEYGPMEKGEDPYGENRDIEIPKQTNDFDKTRGFVKTGMEAGQTADETVGVMKDKIASDYQDGSVTYEPISNEATLKDANIRINQNGWEEEAQHFSDAISKGTRITAEDIAVAERCIQEAQKAGNYEAAANIISDLSIVGTEYGQAIQALSMLKRLSPEGQLKTLLKVQKRINNQLMARGQKPVMDITPEVQAEFLSAKDNAERDAIWNREIAKAASQTSGTWREKINALRYAAMLSNPKTHIRNMIGNFVMQTAYVPRNIISGTLQDIKGGEKTHSLIATFKNTTGNTGKELREYAQSDLVENAERSLRNIGNRYDDVSGEFESQRRTFGDSAVGRGLEQIAGKGKYSVGSMLDKEDMLFKKLTYKNALIDYMKANGISVDDAKSGVTKPNGANIAKGREYAIEQAKKATFTEDNIAAEWLSQGERKLGVAGAITIGSIMPFKKTPLNILSRGIEFSPVGAGMTAYKLYHAVSGKKGLNGSYYDMNDVMDSLGANLTGSGILALGMYLASQGLLVTTGDDDEERKARYDSQMGDQNFAVVNPETGESWTIDWLAPAAMPLLTGVEVYRQLFGDKDDVDDNTLNKALESASKIADPVFEMSCMQGVASALASYSGDAGDIASSLMSNVSTGIAGQFVPQPMAALARTIDDTVRSSYAPKDSNVPLGKTMESFLRQQRSKIPVASQQNEPSIDVWGNERKREFAGSEGEEVLKRAINNFINPTTYSTDKRTELDKELEALYKLTGNAGVLPKSATNYVTVDGTNYQKTPAEKTAYDKTKGQKSKQYVSDFVNSSAYKTMDNATKADIITDLYNLASYEAKKEMLSKRGVWKEEYETAQYENVLKSRTSPATYYAVNGKLNGLEADKDKNGKSVSGSRQEKVVAYLNDEKKAGNITDEQWWYFYTKEYSSQAKNAPYAWIREANK